MIKIFLIDSRTGEDEELEVHPLVSKAMLSDVGRHWVVPGYAESKGMIGKRSLLPGMLHWGGDMPVDANFPGTKK